MGKKQVKNPLEIALEVSRNQIDLTNAAELRPLIKAAL